MRNLLVCVVAVGLAVASLVGRVHASQESERDAALQQSEPYATEDHMFASGDTKLSGRLYAPADRQRFPVIVMVSGSGNESVIGGAYVQILAQAFTKAGIGVFAYDKRGTGRSGGKFTGSDFKALGADAAAAVRFARRLKNVDRVGVWGISQAGWIIPNAIAAKPGAKFAILVSPPGLNPFEQVEFFMHNQVRGWGLSGADAKKADAMHRATALYYSGRLAYAKAQAVVDSYRGEPWFEKVISHPYWHKMTADGRLLTPAELAAEVAAHPDEFEIYRAKSSFVNYARAYEVLRLPTLLIYGSADELVPVQRSRAVIEPALRRAGTTFEVKVFDGADHNIQTPDQHVRQDYLDSMVAWAKAQLG